MMYKLRFQKCGPYAWGDVHVVVGDIGAIHSLYNSLVATTRPGKSDWERLVVAEVTAANATGEFDKVFQSGTFKPSGAPIVAAKSAEE